MKIKLNNLLNKSVEIQIMNIFKNQFLFLIGVIIFVALDIKIGFETILINDNLKVLSYQNISSYIIFFYVIIKLICWRLNKIQIIKIIIFFLDSLLLIIGIAIIIAVFNNNEKDFFHFWNGFYISNIDPNIYKYNTVVNYLSQSGITTPQINKYYDWKIAEESIKTASYDYLSFYSRGILRQIKAQILQEITAVVEVKKEVTFPIKDWIIQNKNTIIGVVVVAAFCLTVGYYLGSTVSSQGTDVNDILNLTKNLKGNTDGEIVTQIYGITYTLAKRIQSDFITHVADKQLNTIKCANLIRITEFLQDEKAVVCLVKSYNVTQLVTFFKLIQNYSKVTININDANWYQEIQDFILPILDHLN